MPTLRDLAGMAFALVVALSVAGCGGDRAGGSAQIGGTGQEREPSGRAPGAPFGQPDDAEAIGAPIRVPAVTEAQGQPLDAVLRRIEARVAEQCGGDLCVSLQVDERDVSDFTSCEFVTTDPAPGTWVDRGTTVVVVAGAQLCDGHDGGHGQHPEGGDGQQPEGGDGQQPEGDYEDETGQSDGEGGAPDDSSQPTGTP